MVKVKTSVVINRPVEEVFKFWDDPDNNAQWQTGLIESKQTSEGARGVGSTLLSVNQFLGRRLEFAVEITEYEPNRRVGFNTSGPFPFSGTTSFEAVEGGTRVELEAEGDVSGIFKLAEPIVARTAQRQFEGNYLTLKDVLEAGA